MADADTMDKLIESLRRQRERLQQGGGAERLAKQRQQGKLTARERIETLVDPGSLEEFGLFAQHRQTQFGMAGRECPADGVVTGAATIDGRLVHLASQDFTVLGGSAGEVHSLKIADAMNRLPKLVCSRTLRAAAWGPATLAKDAAAEVARLKREGDGDMYVFGSADLSRTLMNAQLFDEYRLGVAPVIHGRGRLLFGEGLNPQQLALRGARLLSNG